MHTLLGVHHAFLPLVGQKRVTNPQEHLHGRLVPSLNLTVFHDCISDCPCRCRSFNPSSCHFLPLFSSVFNTCMSLFQGHVAGLNSMTVACKRKVLCHKISWSAMGKENKKAKKVY